MLPQQGEILGRVVKISGGNQVIVQCVDGITRLCRIRGKMKRRMWIRERDIVLVSPWDFDDKRADIIWRYIKDHADWLQNNGYLDQRAPGAKPAEPPAPPAPSPIVTAAPPAAAPAAQPESQ